MADRFGSYTPSFYTAGAVVIVGASITSLMMFAKKQPENYDVKQSYDEEHLFVKGQLENFDAKQSYDEEFLVTEKVTVLWINRRTLLKTFGYHIDMPCMIFCFPLSAVQLARISRAAVATGNENNILFLVDWFPLLQAEGHILLNRIRKNECCIRGWKMLRFRLEDFHWVQLSELKRI